jgi:hypothetical protein
LEAQRVFLKPIRYHFGLRVGLARAQQELKIREKLRKIGISIPKAGIVTAQVGHETRYFLAISPFLLKGSKTSKLIPINDNPNQPAPTFLAKLDPLKDRLAIEQTARLAAKIVNAGIGATHFDYIGFYHSSVGWTPVVMDTEMLYEFSDNSQSRAPYNILSEVASVLPDGSEVYNLFRKVFLQTLDAYP